MEVHLDGALRNAELAGDDAVALTGSDQEGDVALTRGQQRRHHALTPRHPVIGGAHRARVEPLGVAGDAGQALAHGVDAGGAEQKAVRTELDRIDRGVAVAFVAEQDEARRQPASAGIAQHVEAGRAGVGEVEDRKLRTAVEHGRARRRAVGDRRHDVELLLFQQGFHRRRKQRQSTANDGARRAATVSNHATLEMQTCLQIRATRPDSCGTGSTLA